jgi:glutathione S-transferase
VLDAKVGTKPFVCGQKPTIADCTLFAAFELAAFAGIDLGLGSAPNVARWYESFRQRPSAQA